ncbi:MAG TPA: 3-hydroxyacyl-CoA dehydrogenase NAD-binding domain-containing protein [Thermoanaerobaculia bacterium]|nr:3-hydroxyacyl-CoA dehydrogenase NAD-binding domain-containing protein [Thermoanaerobaculia bacterium]
MTSVAATPPPSTTARAFTIDRQGDLAVVWFDLPGEKVNKFSSPVLRELSGVLDELAASHDLKKIVFASRKPGIFIAGADVTEFTTVTGAEQAKAYVLLGQEVFTKLSKLPQVTVAAIDGACVGGGCEMALSCDWRVMSDSPRAQIGLPEVKLGIFPAWGGTSKLPRLIGLPGALDIILKGKTLDGKRAKKIGLVDDVVESGIVVDVAKKFADRGKRNVPGRTKFYIEGNPVARNLIFNKARQGVMKQTRGHYPAPLKAIEVMAYAMANGVERGMAREAEEAAALVNNDVAKNLVQLFFLMEESKKDPYTTKPHDISYVGVLGAGVMGGGIAQIVADKTDAEVRMRDINLKAIGGGMKAASKVWRKKVERRRMTRGEMSRKLARITGTTDWTGFSRADVVIEAVVESIPIKRQVLAEFEALAKPGAIFATNTSTIPITQIAAEAKHPENVVGMHFFNPVDKMPLVEVIRGEKTSDAAMITTAALARKLGKTVVYCNDGPGFVVNRILGPYMNESGFLLQEGNSIESLDKAMVDFGMPMGPMALLDEVGIDVAAKVAGILMGAFGHRMEKSEVVEKLYADGRHGKKNGKGLYLYENGKRKGPDTSVYQLLGITPHPADDRAVVERMLLAMVNEASLILEEKIVASAGELDLAMIMGTGFPPFRGGLLRYADSLGLPYVVSRLDELSSRVGKRYTPNAPLAKLAARDGKFYQTYVRS